MQRIIPETFVILLGGIRHGRHRKYFSNEQKQGDHHENSIPMSWSYRIIVLSVPTSFWKGVINQTIQQNRSSNLDIARNGWVACRTVRTRTRAVLVVCSALVDDEVDGPLEVVLEATMIPRMTAITSARRKSLRSWTIVKMDWSILGKLESYMLAALKHSQIRIRLSNVTRRTHRSITRVYDG